jgi:threonine dehydrogenase-like Zn-dependent dehydrogenase
MKALMKESPIASYIYKNLPVPQPKEGELLIKVNKVAICGSDITLYQWGEVAKTIACIPFVPGHEAVGEIIAVGPNTPLEYEIGKRVCVENHYYCGKCYQCTHDEPHICQNLNQFGHGKGTPFGGCSEYTIVPAKYAYLLRTNLEDSKAVLLER